MYNPWSVSAPLRQVPAIPNTSERLQRRIGLRSAVLFNMLEMIGVGPFITLPLVIAAAGFRLSVWAWVLGAAIAVADGLVWAELGAAMPDTGGSYEYLQKAFAPSGYGRLMGFLFLWQVMLGAPLTAASVNCLSCSGVRPKLHVIELPTALPATATLHWPASILGSAEPYPA